LKKYVKVVREKYFGNVLKPCVMTKPLLMGVLNATPDSFFDKGSYFSFEKGIARGLQMVEEGADILDIGGASTHPKAPTVDTEEEIRRTIPLIEVLASQVKVPISIDTVDPKVARLALEKGASMINDISGFRDPKMRELAGSCLSDLCLMHMQGTPSTMQIEPSYPDGVVEEILRFFEQQIELLAKEGVNPSRIILDPGISFGKTLEHNTAIFKGIDRFKSLGLRVMVGASRKGFMSKILGRPLEELLAPTLAVHAIAFLRGADIFRVHDVKEHRDAFNVAALLL
jgi:dihydropteroate synthase